MLFISESVHESRLSLQEDLKRGRLIEEQAWRQALELDPDDHVALMYLSRARREAGDLQGAEQLLWSAILAHPCQWHPYIELGELVGRESHQDALAHGLTELGVRILLLDEENVKTIGHIPLPKELRDTAGFGDLSTREQLEVVAAAMRQGRDLEPESVTARLKPYRLLCRLQEVEDLDAQFVDALVREGTLISPLLIGVLRDWAQNELPDELEQVVENALAVLGEIGDPAVIPQLLEFSSINAPDLSGAAHWALDRIVILQPEESLRLMNEVAPSLGEEERTAVVETLLRHPRLDPTGGLLARLAENLYLLEEEDRGRFLPLLLSAMISARGRAGLELAGVTLRKTAHLLPRRARRECDDLIQAFGDSPPPPLSIPRLPPWTVYDICSGNAYWEDEEAVGEDQEEAFSPPEPVRRKPAPGRNDPCWCGSGKKYKKCHLDADQQPQSKGQAARGVAPSGEDEFSGLRARLGDFLKQAVPDSEGRSAVKAFFGGEEPGDTGVSELADWMMHDWISTRFGRTVMQEYLRRLGDDLTKRERELLESWSRSYVGLYEVQEVREGSGVTVKDLTSDEELFVHDVSLSKTLVRWDGLLARVIDGERGLEFTGLGLSVPRQHIEPLRSWMVEDRRRTGNSWELYLKNNRPRIRRRLIEMGREWISSLQLTNTDGEELLFSKAVYRVLDRPAVSAALEGCPELTEDEEGKRHVWMKGPPEEEGRTVLGSISMEGGKLAFECNSKERLKRGKELLAGIAGGALKHVRDEFTTVQEMKRRALKEPRAAEQERDRMPPQVEQELITEFMEQHFAKWPDTSLPALDGSTPREAVKTDAGRRTVSLLLRDFENAEERKRRAGKPHYDINRLRAELGVAE